MTHAPKHEQFQVDALLKTHLSAIGDTLSELLFAYADINAMAALSPLRNGAPLSRRRQAAQITLLRDCLVRFGGVEGNIRSDFYSAVLWHGARLDEFIERLRD